MSRATRVQPFVLRLGKPAREAVSDDERHLHRWVANKLTRSSFIDISRTAETVVLAADRVRQSPEEVRDLIEFNPEADEPWLGIIDCSKNSYLLFREHLLLYLGETAAMAAAAPSRICLILLPQLPHGTHSIFWDPLESMQAQGGSVLVISNDGITRQFGRTVDLSQDFSQRYRDKYRQLNNTMAEVFAEKKVRRLGHFRVGEPGERYCSRYFYDASRAVQELGELLASQVTLIRRSNPVSSTKMVIVMPTSDWLYDAALIAASRSQLKRIEWHIGDDSSSNNSEPETGIKYIPIFDFVNTGATAHTAIASLKDAGFSLSKAGVAAFAAQDYHVKGADPLAIEVIHRVKVDRALSQDCDQCRLGLPHTQTDLNDSYKLRSYDAWEMLLDVKWGPEEYGPPGSLLEEYFPDFPTLFSEYGDFIAYKLERLLQRVVSTYEIALVCPEEPAIEKLIDRVQPWADDRLVSVRVPREVLDLAAEARFEELGGLDEYSEWSRQLRHLSERKARVVVLDEFNASNRTAHAILKVLRAFGVQPRAYIPIFSRIPGQVALDNIPVMSLYELPSPRGESR